MKADSALRAAPNAIPPALQPPQRAGLRAALPFVLGSGLLGTIGVFVHEAHADPLSATWFRCAFGLLGLTAWLSWRRQLGALKLEPRTTPWVLLAGVLLVAGWALFFAAIERTSTAVAVVLYQAQPFWVLLLGRCLLKERIGGRRLTGVTVAMAGLALATGLVDQPGTGGQGLSSGYWIGVLGCLVGALGMAGVTIIAKRLGAMPAGILAWWQCAFGTATLWIVPVLQGWPASVASWIWLAGLGLIHTGLAYSLMYAGMARLSTGRVAALQFVYPAVAIVVDWLYFDHRLSAVQVSGVALMAVAIWFSESRGRDRIEPRRLAIGAEPAPEVDGERHRGSARHGVSRSV
jgi:drug/metabolite transporter (DMT)-like permease